MSKMHSPASIERIKLSRSFELKLKCGDPIFCKKDADIRKRIRNQQRSFFHAIFQRLYLKVSSLKQNENENHFDDSLSDPQSVAQDCDGHKQ